MIKNGSISFLVTTLACLQSNQYPSWLFWCRANTQSSDDGYCLRFSESFTLTPVRGNTLVQIYFEHIVWLNNRYYTCEFRQYHLSSTSTSRHRYRLYESTAMYLASHMSSLLSHPRNRIYVALEWHTENYLLGRGFVSGTVDVLQIQY